MAKFTIAAATDIDFELIGISSHIRNYRICWLVNNALAIDLNRSDDLEIIKKKEALLFCFFNYIDEENNIEYYLIANKCENGLLIQEKHTIDYFLLLKGNTTNTLIEKIQKKLSNQDDIIMTQQLEITKLKSHKNLLF